MLNFSWVSVEEKDSFWNWGWENEICWKIEKHEVGMQMQHLKQVLFLKENWTIPVSYCFWAVLSYPTISNWMRTAVTSAKSYNLFIIILYALISWVKLEINPYFFIVPLPSSPPYIHFLLQSGLWLKKHAGRKVWAEKGE